MLSSTVNEALNTFCTYGTYETFAFVALVATLPHFPAAFRLGLDISTSNPPQGALYFFLVSNFVCYGYELRLFEMPGFDAQVGGDTKCARVKAGAEEDMAKLLRAFKDPSLVFAPDLHFFQPMRNPALELPGDITGQARAAPAAEDGQDGPAERDRDEGGGERD